MNLNGAPVAQMESAVACARCGAHNPPGAAFCTQCGQRLPTPAGSPPWGAADIARGVGVAVFSAMVLIAIGALAIRGLHLPLSLGTAIISGGLELVLLGAVWVFAKRQYHLSWSALGFRATAGGGKLAYASLGIVVSVAIVAGYSSILRVLGWEDAVPKTPLFDDKDKTGIIVLGAFLAAILAPVAEETFFRGFVFGGLRKSVGPWAAAIMSAALFMLAHISPAVFIPIFLIGLVLAWVYLKTGSLWYSILTHMGYNALVVFVALR